MSWRPFTHGFGVRRLAWTVALSATGLVACLGPTLVVQQYAGPVRSQESVAILRVNGSEPVQLILLDDEDVAVPLAQDSRLHIEMLPGEHTLSVRNAASTRGISSLALSAEAGRVYRVVLDPSGERAAGARVFEVDRSSDALLREVPSVHRSKRRDPVAARLVSPEAPLGAEDAGAAGAGDASPPVDDAAGDR